MGFLVSAELIHPLFYNYLFLAGFGLEMQLPRGVKNTDGNFYFLSLYPVLRFRPYAENFPHLMIRGGINFFYGDRQYKSAEWKGDEYFGYGYDRTVELSNYLHYGLGIGIFINDKYLVEVLYNLSLGKRIYHSKIYTGTKYSLPDRHVDVDYRVISFTLGIWL